MYLYLINLIDISGNKRQYFPPPLRIRPILTTHIRYNTVHAINGSKVKYILAVQDSCNLSNDFDLDLILTDMHPTTVYHSLNVLCTKKSNVS